MSDGQDLGRPESPAIVEDAGGAGAPLRRHGARGRSPSAAPSEGSARDGSRSATPRDAVQRIRARTLGRSMSPATTSSAARWRAFLTRRLPDIMTTEGLSTQNAMMRVAAEWREAKEADAVLLLLAEMGITDPCERAGSEDGTPAGGRKRRLCSTSPHSPRYKGFAPRKQRARSQEMHECLVNAGQEMQHDKLLFQSLRGAELQKLDHRHRHEGRYKALKRSLGVDRLPDGRAAICRFISTANLRCSSGSCFCRADTKALNFSCLSFSFFFASSASFLSWACLRACASSAVSSSTTGSEPAPAGTECAAPAAPCCAPPTTPPTPAPPPANVTLLFVAEQRSHGQSLYWQFFVCPFFNMSTPWLRHLPHFCGALALVADAGGGGALFPDPLAPPPESAVMVDTAAGTPASYIEK